VQGAIAAVREEARRCKGVAVTAPHKAAILGLKRVVDLFKTWRVEIAAVVENMYDNPFFAEHVDEYCIANGYKLVKVPCLLTEDMEPDPVSSSMLTREYDWSELIEAIR